MKKYVQKNYVDQLYFNKKIKIKQKNCKSTGNGNNCTP